MHCKCQLSISGMISDGRVLLYFEEPKEIGTVQFIMIWTASVGLVKLVPSMPADILIMWQDAVMQ